MDLSSFTSTLLSIFSTTLPFLSVFVVVDVELPSEAVSFFVSVTVPSFVVSLIVVVVPPLSFSTSVFSVVVPVVGSVEMEYVGETGGMGYVGETGGIYAGISTLIFCFALTTAENARIPFVYHCFSAENQNAEFMSIELNGAEIEN